MEDIFGFKLSPGDIVLATDVRDSSTRQYFAIVKDFTPQMVRLAIGSERYYYSRKSLRISITSINDVLNGLNHIDTLTEKLKSPHHLIRIEKDYFKQIVKNNTDATSN